MASFTEIGQRWITTPSLATVELTIISILLAARLQLNRSAVAGLEYRLALDRTQWYRDFLPSNLH